MGTVKTIVNQFPTLTWNHLKINRAEFNQEIHGVLVPEVKTAGKVFYAEKKSADVSYAAGIKTGLGKEFDSIFDQNIKEIEAMEDIFCVNEITVPANYDCNENCYVKFNCEDGDYLVSDVVINAEENSRSHIICIFDGERDAEGFCGGRIRVKAAANSYVQVVIINKLGNKFDYLTGFGSSVGDDAVIELTQLELGGNKSYTGICNELEGYRAKYKGEMAYIVNGSRLLDINQVVNQTGRQTESSFTVNGAVMDKGSKTWRGTIDFKRGCVDAKGDEQEDVLVLDPEIVNKSLPVILCDEEAVEGRHGCTIGKMDNENLFYMQSRGVDERTARNLLVRAKAASVCSYIPDAELTASILDYVEGEYSK